MVTRGIRKRERKCHCCGGIVQLPRKIDDYDHKKTKYKREIICPHCGAKANLIVRKNGRVLGLANHFVKIPY